MRTTRFLLSALIVLGLFGGDRPAGKAAEPDLKLAQQARAVLEKYCYRCHGQNGADEGKFGSILDIKGLLAHRKLGAGDPAKSRIFIRMGVRRTMPPEDEQPRPTDDDVALIKRWIEAGAPAAAEVANKTRSLVRLKGELGAMRDYLRKARREDRPYLRFFTLRHLHNLPAEQVRDQDLRVYQAALSKLVNSLSWKHAIVLPDPVDAQHTVFAVDIRQLDWDRKRLWQEILRLYPYGLKHDHYPDDPAVNDLAGEVYDLAGTDIPAVRADWFLATASRQPLYHLLLQIPESAYELERLLNVNVEANFARGQLARAAFNGSGVSIQNRMVERHDAVYGAYWKSYDFRTSAGTGNLFVFPLGPIFDANPFVRQAFKHAGGEIIFNLPNGLQGYLLVDDKGKRLDAGPVEIVSDSKKTSGTPLVVNGLSCMNCHQHGMNRFKDQLRDSNILGGEARDKVRQLYLPAAEMDKLVVRDENRFLHALDQAIRPLFKGSEDAGKDIKDFPEPISAIARWYLVQELTAVEAARELGLDDARTLQGAVQANPRLQELGLLPLVKGGTVKREVWEFLEFTTSPFQEAARELKLGTPIRYQ